MCRQNKKRTNPKKMVRVAHAAPQDHPVSHQGEGPQVNSDSERPRQPWKDERMAMSYTIHNLKYKLERLEGLMDLREREFKAELKNKYEIIASHEATISNLKSDLQFRVAQVENLKHQSNQEKDDMAARLEAEKQKLAEQNNQMLQLDLDKQKSVLLQIDLQMKQLKELEQELQQKDDVICHLRKEKVGLSNKLTEATDQLTNYKAEFLQSNHAWQTKYEALQEKFSQLEVKEQSWKTSVEQVEEQKKELEELAMKLKASKKEKTECLLQNDKDWQAKYDAEKEHKREEKMTQVEETNQEMEETTTELEENQQILEVTVNQVDVKKTEPEDICFRTEEETEVKKQSTTDKKMRKKETKAMKLKQKQETEDLKKKQEEEEKELKSRQKLEKLQEKEMNKKKAQMKAELQKRAKEEKKEMKRKEKERKNGGKKCDSDAKVEQAGGCSIKSHQ
ncbi:DNA ligase 1-like [Acanthopagrus latus]|uniref:DNA ligase 1-like n=1 Tax=Acanthopagrus latus TaxID=8177 RepID=UPI00187C0A65|nr:DNA ligase 1-like [Acanthopagrus latus]